VQKIEIEKPSDLRDLVWLPVQITWSNGGMAPAHIPVRYPGTEETTDGPLRLARKTEWRTLPDDTFLGLGQRQFTSDLGEHALFECTTLELTPG
jgi:type VI secretion system protein ImpE